MRQEAAPARSLPGAIRLFRFSGIDVFLHWSWAIVAMIEFQSRTGHYELRIWNAIEYVSLFAIVLIHEFGHALACRSVGGRADHILLWPLGGIAYVDPPRRPGAVLWSIAAGPLVNVALIPVTFGALIFAEMNYPGPSDLNRYLDTVTYINLALLIFNMLPIYPLDGGQIVQSILWFFVGFARSLMIASSLGLVAAAGVILFALYMQDIWLGILAVFGISQSYRGLMHARYQAKLFKLPRSERLACPSCKEPAPKGMMWRCSCGQSFDVFASGGQCPNCMTTISVAPCPFCGKASRPVEWAIVASD